MATLDECDVLLLPSLSEGMPTVVLEAMARGLQIIGSDVGAMNVLEDELIAPRVTLAFSITQSRKTKKNRV